MTDTLSYVTSIKIAARHSPAVTSLFAAAPIALTAALWQSASFSINEALSPLASLSYWSALAAVIAVQALVSVTMLQLSRPAVPLRWRVGVVAGIYAANVVLAATESIAFKHFWGLPLAPEHEIVRTLLLASAPVAVMLSLAHFGIVASGVVLELPPAIISRGSLKRMPKGLYGQVRLLHADDHYIHVHTNSGRGMIKYRFADAIAELGTETGLQVHKSWWISYSAVAALERQGGRYVVRLDGGEAIPVARSYVAAVKRKLSERMMRD